MSEDSSSNGFQTISSFMEILDFIGENTLTVLDIDETVLEYAGVNDNYWNTLFSSHYHIFKDYDVAEQETLKEWNKLIKRTVPKHTDKEGLEMLFKRNGEVSRHKIIFLTARKHEMRGTTELQFKKLGIPDSMMFFDGDDKGKRLEEIVKLIPGVNDIIFVDDLEYNIDDVNRSFGNIVKCFKFLRSSQCKESIDDVIESL